jgi:hypothetical protein
MMVKSYRAMVGLARAKSLNCKAEFLETMKFVVDLIGEL